MQLDLYFIVLERWARKYISWKSIIFYKNAQAEEIDTDMQNSHLINLCWRDWKRCLFMQIWPLRTTHTTAYKSDGTPVGIWTMASLK